MSQPRLEIRNVGKEYGTRTVLRDVSLSVDAGEFVTLVGPSGCGKTTLLRIVSGALEPSRGKVFLEGEDITYTPVHLRNMGMVFQNFALFPHLTVAQNLAFPLKIRKIPRSMIDVKVKQALEMVGLEAVSHQFPRELSGGQQQRVGLARAMIYEPKIVLFDEPLSNLDAKLRVELRNVIAGLVHELSITAIYVTHDQSEALALSDRVAVVQNGVIVQCDAPEIVYSAPSDPFVATFIGNFNVFHFARQSQQLYLRETLNDAQPFAIGPGEYPALPNEVTDDVVLYMQPRNVGLHSRRPDNSRWCVPGQVLEASFSGYAIEYVVEVAPTLRVNVQKDLTETHALRSVERGQMVWLEFPPDKWLYINNRTVNDETA
jgi:ABC-type Fe3+/spermidine/putrescine transport system ATPase subunit